MTWKAALFSVNIFPNFCTSKSKTFIPCEDIIRNLFNDDGDDDGDDTDDSDVADDDKSEVDRPNVFIPNDFDIVNNDIITNTNNKLCILYQSSMNY